jgi:beta-galactosidase
MLKRSFYLMFIFIVLLVTSLVSLDSFIFAIGELDRTGWVASGTGKDFSNAFDGNASTRWDTNAYQTNGQYFQVDMQSAKTFNQIRLDTTGSANDYPRSYQVYVSSDGSNWGSAIASGSGTSAITDITFSSQTKRYLKIVQTGSASGNYWSIHEFNLYNSSVTPTPTKTPTPTPTPGSSPLDRTGWVGSGTGQNFINAFDGNASTRWSTDAMQTNGQYFQVDLQSAKTFNQIRLDTTGSPNDYPRGYQVFVSSDNTNWGSSIATGSGTSAITDITFSVQTTRYLKVVQTGSAAGNYWSIHEFNAYNSSSTTPTPTPTPTSTPTPTPIPGSVPIGQTISLKCTSNNYYVSSENGTVVMNCNRTSVGIYEKFLVVDAGSGNIALKGYGADIPQNKYVCSENGTAAMNCNRDAIGAWETFTWVSNTDGTISLKGSNVQYVTGAAPMWCNVAAISAAEKFQWQAVSPDPTPTPTVTPTPGPTSTPSATWNPPVVNVGNRQETELSGSGWYLWLDKTASWQNDTLYPKDFTISSLPVNAPTCGWSSLFSSSVPWNQVSLIKNDTTKSLQVSVPGTVEEYWWDTLSPDGKGSGTSGNYTGVSWWGRDFNLSSFTGKKVKIWVENTKYRCEVYVNQKLVGYDCVGNLPFESDITSAIVSGTNKLSLRITDPGGGEFAWGDFGRMTWGSSNTTILRSHDFGGVMGRVKIVVEDPVHITDIYVKNKPTITDIDANIEIANEGTSSWSGSMTVNVLDIGNSNTSVYATTINSLSISAGQKITQTVSISLPNAKKWDIGQGNLYYLKAVLNSGDGQQQRFGFRWFDLVNHVSVAGANANAMYKLNGKRIFTKTAISWGFFPANGMYTTVDVARQQITAAQQLGLNMLNFHRCIGQTMIFDMADEMGLLYFEEPGGYSSYYCYLFNSPYNYTESTLPRTDQNLFVIGRQIGGEKLTRMVKRDRSHPALVQINMVNEAGHSPIQEAKDDMAAAHTLDPTRLITYSSGFEDAGQTQENKLHMLPNNINQYTYGYCDTHNAGGPGVYLDAIYSGPTTFLRNTSEVKELMFWGEEGAIASLPRLQKLYDYYSNSANRRGWDGSDYVNWYNGFLSYITGKNLSSYYPSLDNLTLSSGNVAYYHHGRMIENSRINNLADGFAINGWECEKQENYSGIVDPFRNLKGDVKLLSDYTRPLYVAVKARDKIGHIGGQVIVDMFIVNENALAGGTYTLQLTKKKPDNSTVQVYSGNVTVTGGEKFGELLAQGITVNLDGGKGYYNLTAVLLNGSTQVADGHEELLAVDWQSMTLPTSGAIASNSTGLINFLNTTKGLNLPQFATSLGTLKYIVATGAGDFEPIPYTNFLTANQASNGLTMDLFQGANFETQIRSQVSQQAIDFNDSSKLFQGSDLTGPINFSIRWTGYLVPSKSDTYTIQTISDDGLRLWIDLNNNGTFETSEKLVDNWYGHPAITAQVDITLTAGTKYLYKMEFQQQTGGYQVSFKWKLKNPQIFSSDEILNRVNTDGTILYILDSVDTWMPILQSKGIISSYSMMTHGSVWVGGGYFVRQHPFFNDLPVNGAMNWEYQLFVNYWGPPKQYGFGLSGEVPVVSDWNNREPRLCTAVGILNYGKGKIVFSTVDIVSNLGLNTGAADVPKKVLCNYLIWSNNPI